MILKKDNEKIGAEYLETLIDLKDKRYLVNILITDKNILLFYDTTKDNALRTKIYELP